MSVSKQEAIRALEEMGANPERLARITGGTTGVESPGRFAKSVAHVQQQEAIDQLRKQGVSEDELQRRGIIPEESLLTQFGRGAAGFGAGALQGLSKVGQGLGEAGIALQKYLPPRTGAEVSLEAPAPDVYAGPLSQFKGTFPAKVGEYIGQAGGELALGGAGASLGRAAGFAPAVATALGFGGAGAGATPGGVLPRAIAGATGAVPFPAIHQAARLARPRQFSLKSLAKVLRKTKARESGISKGLYSEAFAGTKSLKPTLSGETSGILGKAKNLAESDVDIRKSVKTFSESEKGVTEALHGMKADFGKFKRKLEKRNETLGLTKSEQAKLKFLERSEDVLEKDIKRNLNKVSPDRFEKYQAAQQHFAERIVPLTKEYPSLKKLFGKKEITKALFTDVGRDAPRAELIRKMADLETLGLGGKELRKLAKYLGTAALIGTGIKILK